MTPNKMIANQKNRIAKKIFKNTKDITFIV